MTAEARRVAAVGEPATRVRRLPEKQRLERAALDDVLSSGLLAHVGFEHEGWPYVIPVAYAPWRDGIVIHGSTGSRMFRALAAGAPACVTITHLDALVLARSAFESSMSYRGAMLFGRFDELGEADKSEALDALTDHLLPGRRLARPGGLRPRSRKEDAATMVLYLAAERWSVKVGNSFAQDPEEDLQSHADLWAGRVPLRTVLGPAEPDPTAASRDVAVPDHVSDWLGPDAAGHPAFAAPEGTSPPPRDPRPQPHLSPVDPEVTP